MAGTSLMVPRRYAEKVAPHLYPGCRPISCAESLHNKRPLLLGLAALCHGYEKQLKSTTRRRGRFVWRPKTPRVLENTGPD